MANAETVGDLVKRKARIAWSCDVGKALGHIGAHGGDVDLEALSKARGEGFTLANRRPRCPVRNCPGRAAFKDASSVYWKTMDTITTNDPAWWAYRDVRDAELTELGWRMDTGYWRPPEGWPDMVA